MAAPKIQTLQARFGFADPDLKKPVHDEMIKWLDYNIEDILTVIWSLSVRPKGVRTKWEPLVRMTQDGGQFIGFLDFMACYDMMSSCVLFEAKTAIESLGELFRQLHLYRAGYIAGQSVSKMPLVVVCPQDTHAETIREQGFYFLKFDPKMTFPPCI